MRNTISQYLEESITILTKLDQEKLEKMIITLAEIQANQGRVFFLGVGGGAANCSHAVADFRKILGIEAYCPSDNIAELTARINDQGWSACFVEYLKISHLSANDAIFVFSVGGGSLEYQISPNLVLALEYAKTKNSKILGVVGPNGGYTAKLGDAVLQIPEINANSITPHTEAMQTLILHLLVSQPCLQKHSTKWESVITHEP